MTSEGTVKWIDGTCSSYFTSWYHGQPNTAGGNQDCTKRKQAEKKETGKGKEGNFASTTEWHDNSRSYESLNYPRYLAISSTMSYVSENDCSLSNYNTSSMNTDMNIIARDACTAVGMSINATIPWLGLNDIEGTLKGDGDSTSLHRV